MRRNTPNTCLPGLALHGYEIHHGETGMDRLKPLIQSKAGDIIGGGDDSGRIWGTYLHGLFDADEFRRWVLNRVRIQKGLEAASGYYSALHA